MKLNLPIWLDGAGLPPWRGGVPDEGEEFLNCVSLAFPIYFVRGCTAWGSPTSLCMLAVYAGSISFIFLIFFVLFPFSVLVSPLLSLLSLLRFSQPFPGEIYLLLYMSLFYMSILFKCNKSFAIDSIKMSVCWYLWVCFSRTNRWGSQLWVSDMMKTWTLQKVVVFFPWLPQTWALSICMQGNCFIFCTR